jgi:formylglycine-generating enzyme required for sulfatase activity
LTDEEDRLIGERTMLVGLFGSNEFGLRDMHGNVWEWVESCYDKVADDTACQRRVLRGGSWYDFQNYARSANRSFNDPYDRINFIGFRVLCSSPIP